MLGELDYEVYYKSDNVRVYADHSDVKDGIDCAGRVYGVISKIGNLYNIYDDLTGDTRIVNENLVYNTSSLKGGDKVFINWDMPICDMIIGHGRSMFINMLDFLSRYVDQIYDYCVCDSPMTVETCKNEHGETEYSFVFNNGINTIPYKLPDEMFILYSREPEVKEMSLFDIEKELGYKIKLKG